MHFFSRALARTRYAIHLPALALLLATSPSLLDDRAVLAEEADSDAIIGECSNYEPARPVQGSLVICGGGKLPDPVLNSFLELAGGDSARIVVIPTASALADGPEVEIKLTFWRQAKVAALSILHTRSRSMADDPDFVKPLEEATGVWFTGGFQWRLADTYLGTAVDRLVHSVLERGGVIGGTSSGAAIMSTLMIRRSDPDPEVGRGFDFLQGTVIDQHFIKRNRQDRLVNVLENHPGFVGFGIDEGTALVAQGRRLRVIGDSQVIACLAPSSNRPLRIQALNAGDEVDLVAWSRAAIARARPQKAAAAQQPRVAKGALVIVGGGHTPPEAVQDFIEAAGGPDAPLVVVTTAHAQSPSQEEATGWLLRAGARHVRQLHTIDRQHAEDPEVLEMLGNARGIWFEGGRQWRLVDAYLDTRAEKLFHQVLQRGGVIGGSSAGATIQAGYLLRGSPLGNTEVMAEGYERGFGFLPGVAIDQHFTQRDRLADMEQVKRRHPELVGLGLDEDTALVVRGQQCTVIGRGSVSVFPQLAASARPQCKVLHAGDTYEFGNEK
ncbi:MAG TPA: cyanophycinase [Pirellulales bacterium]|nr:cyanophycinase [Pirellulales bacterium]